jgi:steroid 5-alpha reductase family enzyme
MLVLIVAIAIGLWLTMISAWAFQRWVDNPGWVDVFWTFGTGIAGVVAALYPVAAHAWPTERQLLVALLVAAWSLRLGLYMAIRVGTSPEDARYVELREEWGASFQRRMFLFMQNQGIGSILFPLSILIAARHPAPGLRLADWLGAAIVALAIAGESLADRQMRRFKAAPDNAAKVCDVGLWSWSRHPNYFFEWLGWFAYPVIAIDPTGAYPWACSRWRRRRSCIGCSTTAPASRIWSATWRARAARHGAAISDAPALSCCARRSVRSPRGRRGERFSFDVSISPRLTSGASRVKLDP